MQLESVTQVSVECSFRPHCAGRMGRPSYLGPCTFAHSVRGIILGMRGPWVLSAQPCHIQRQYTSIFPGACSTMRLFMRHKDQKAMAWHACLLRLLSECDPLLGWKRYAFHPPCWRCVDGIDSFNCQLFDTNAAIKQVCWAIIGKNPGFICSIHCLKLETIKGGKNIPLHPALRINALQRLTRNKIKGHLKFTKQHCNLRIACLACHANSV